MSLEAVPAEGKHSRSVLLRAVSCPNCAGAVRAEEGSAVVSCGYCGSDFLQSTEEGYTRRYFPVRVPKLTAVGRAMRWLLDCPDAPDDIGESAFTAANLLYLPIWEVRAHVVGYEFGKKVRTRREIRRVGDQEVVTLTTEDETVEAGFLDERRLYREAVDLRTLGMNRPHVTGRDFTLPYLPGALEQGAGILEPQTGPEQVREQARRSFLRPPTGTVARDTRLYLMREKVVLIFYPVWHLRYRYGRRAYEVVVDGRNGVIHAARAPADNRRRLAVMVASYAGLAAGAAVLLSAWREWGVPATVAAYGAVLLFVLAGAVYWRFELLREVEYHEPFSS
ncbi:MAG: hypothetical protein Kow00129_06040 [Thermoleophilia bacterium]